MKKILILTLLFFASCSLDKVIQHHGVHNLDKKQAIITLIENIKKLKIKENILDEV